MTTGSSQRTTRLTEKHREEVRTTFVHSPTCRVHEPHLSLCSCGLETRIKDALVSRAVSHATLWEELCEITEDYVSPLDAVRLLKDAAARFRVIHRALTE